MERFLLLPTLLMVEHLEHADHDKTLMARRKAIKPVLLGLTEGGWIKFKLWP